MAGFAQGDVVRTALAGKGITVAGYRWKWLPGIKLGVFPPHLARHNATVFDIEGWPATLDGAGAFPGLGWNGKTCMCSVKWILRDTKGRFAGEKFPEVEK